MAENKTYRATRKRFHAFGQMNGDLIESIEVIDTSMKYIYDSALRDLRREANTEAEEFYIDEYKFKVWDECYNIWMPIASMRLYRHPMFFDHILLSAGITASTITLMDKDR